MPTTTAIVRQGRMEFVAFDSRGERLSNRFFGRGEMKKITRLYRRDDIPDERCWVRGRGWCLAFE